VRQQPLPPAPPPLQSYLPGLDGLRALAVIAVVVFHSALGIAPGGFLGVEVFFVISGYIITRMLLAERERTGRIAMGSFWGRRARRLLPALFLLLVVVAGYSLVFAPEEAAGLRREIAAAVTYLTNWDLVVTGESYFDSWERPSLLRHLWSLAVEEQFYVVWPLLMAAGLWLLPRRGLLVVVVAGAAASAIAMAVLFEPGSAVTRIYYGTDTRASGLLIGSALAFVWAARQSGGGGGLREMASLSLLTLAGLAGLVTLVGFTLLTDGRSPCLYEGGFALVGVATAALIAGATHDRSPLTRALGMPVLRWIGVRSYGIYLWHWPVMALTRPGIDVPLDGWALFGVQVAITMALATLSYRFVEAPIREGALGRLWLGLRESLTSPEWRRGAAVGIAGMTASAGVAAFVVFLVLAQSPEKPPSFALESVRLVNVVDQVVTEGEGAPVAFSGAATPDALAETAPRAAPAQPPAVDSDARLAIAVREARELAVVEQAASLAALQSTFSRGLAPPAHERPAGPVRVTAIGDSVMLGAARELAGAVSGIDLDAELGRQVWQAIKMLEERKENGLLGEIVLLHLGNNGAFSEEEFDRIMEVVGEERRVVFLTLKVERSWEQGNNEVISEGVRRYPQALVVDWREAIGERPELLWIDGTHLRPEGANFYVELLAPYLRS